MHLTSANDEDFVPADPQQAPTAKAIASKSCAVVPKGSRWTLQVMRYEALMDSLKNAMENNLSSEVHQRMQEVREAYKQLKDVDEAMAVLENGRYDLAARECISDMYHSQFSSQTAPDLPRNPFYGPNEVAMDIRKNPFYAAPPPGPAHHLAKATGVRRDFLPPQATTLEKYVQKPINNARGILKGALDNRLLCRQNTADMQEAGLVPLKHFLRSNAPQTTLDKLTNVLQLRGGGGDPPPATQYGSCCGNPEWLNKIHHHHHHKKKAPTKEDRHAFMEHMTAPYNPRHTLMFETNEWLDWAPIAIGLVTLDLFSTIMMMTIPDVYSWYFMSWNICGFLCLGFMCLQCFLEITLHSTLIQRAIMDDQEVMSVRAFWADDGDNNPHWIPAGWKGTVETMGDAYWRHDTGAYITFTGHTSIVFVSERDFVDLEVVSGLIDYFCNPLNVFNVILLGFCVLFCFISGAGLGGILIVLRFLKPIVKLCSKQDKVSEFKEKHEENLYGEEGEEGEEEEEGALGELEEKIEEELEELEHFVEDEYAALKKMACC